jgi:hypothetical protein
MASSYQARNSLQRFELGPSEQYPRTMFRRGNAAAESAAESERKALFEKLAQRPENVCPFLGLAASRADYHEMATDDHRCYAFGDPEPISGEQQRNVCLQRGYANCPRYLRGVLVIPTDELEALRRPHQPVPPRPPPPPRPAPVAGGGGRRRTVLALLVLLLLVGGGAATWWVVAGPGAVALETPTPIPSRTSEPSPSEAEPSFSVTPSVAPTPEPGDEFIGYEVTVEAGINDVFRVADSGQIQDESEAFFSAVSQGPVDRVMAENGLLHWRETEGGLAGWSFIRDQSGPFRIREVYLGSDGSLRYLVLPEDET